MSYISKRSWHLHARCLALVAFWVEAQTSCQLHGRVGLRKGRGLSVSVSGRGATLMGFESRATGLGEFCMVWCGSGSADAGYNVGSCGLKLCLSVAADAGCYCLVPTYISFYVTYPKGFLCFVGIVLVLQQSFVFPRPSSWYLLSLTFSVYW